jgi:molybdopterin-guanine dinucleotide biosynthesis protein A
LWCVRLRFVEPLLAHNDDAVRRDRPHSGVALAGVVLCGGLSRRMGRDKAGITIDGATLLDRAVMRLDAVCDPVLIAPGDLPITVAGRSAVIDAVPASGPMGGLVGALRVSPHRLLAVVAVDMPWIDPRLLAMLAVRIGDRGVAVCESARGIEPLHAVYSTTLLPAAEAALAGPDRSLQGLIALARAVRVAETDWRGAGVSDGFAWNINTPEDLAEVSRSRR